MLKIFKYEISKAINELMMPKGAEILTVQLQNWKPHIWALCNPNAEKTRRVVAVYGTGWEIDDTKALTRPSRENYIGTIQHTHSGESLVWHLFEI